MINNKQIVKQLEKQLEIEKNMLATLEKELEKISEQEEVLHEKTKEYSRIVYTLRQTILFFRGEAMEK